jgi:hypothetical protein
MRAPPPASPARGWSLLELLLAHSLTLLTLSAVLACVARWQALDQHLEQSEAAWVQIQSLESWMHRGLLRSSMWRGGWQDAKTLPSCGGGLQPCSACSEPNWMAPSGISWLLRPDGSGSLALRLSAGTVQVRLDDGKWQSFTDPDVVQFEQLSCEVRDGLLIVELRARAAHRNAPAWSRRLHLARSRL